MAETSSIPDETIGHVLLSTQQDQTAAAPTSATETTPLLDEHIVDSSVSLQPQNESTKSVVKRPKGPSKAQLLNKLYQFPTPIRTFPLPLISPTNPISIIHFLYTWLKQVLSPSSSHPDALYQAWYSPETRSVHVTDPRAIRALWEQGFYGKGTLSRSEPSWMDREKRKQGAALSQTSEEVTQKRRQARLEAKWERARELNETIERTQQEEQAPTNSQADAELHLRGGALDDNSDTHSQQGDEHPDSHYHVTNIKPEVLDLPVVLPKPRSHGSFAPGHIPTSRLPVARSSHSRSASEDIKSPKSPASPSSPKHHVNKYSGLSYAEKLAQIKADVAKLKSIQAKAEAAKKTEQKPESFTQTIHPPSTSKDPVSLDGAQDVPVTEGQPVGNSTKQAVDNAKQNVNPAESVPSSAVDVQPKSEANLNHIFFFQGAPSATPDVRETTSTAQEADHTSPSIAEAQPETKQTSDATSQDLQASADDIGHPASEQEQVAEDSLVTEETGHGTQLEDSTGRDGAIAEIKTTETAEIPQQIEQSIDASVQTAKVSAGDVARDEQKPQDTEMSSASEDAETVQDSSENVIDSIGQNSASEETIRDEQIPAIGEINDIAASFANDVGPDALSKINDTVVSGEIPSVVEDTADTIAENGQTNETTENSEKAETKIPSTVDSTQETPTEAEADLSSSLSIEDTTDSASTELDRSTTSLENSVLSEPSTVEDSVSTSPSADFSSTNIINTEREEEAASTESKADTDVAERTVSKLEPHFSEAGQDQAPYIFTSGQQSPQSPGDSVVSSKHGLIDLPLSDRPSKTPRLEDEEAAETVATPQVAPPNEEDALWESIARAPSSGVNFATTEEIIKDSNHLGQQTIDFDSEVDIAEQEHLQLTFEESFFLSYGFGVLDVLDPNTKTKIPIKQLFKLYRASSSLEPSSPKPDDPFLISYVAYHHFRSLGWVVRGGIKFGVDYLLYNRGPPFSHAEFAISVMPAYTHPYWSSTPELTTYVRSKLSKSWSWLHCMNRVNTQVKKTLILVYVEVPEPLAKEAEEAMEISDVLRRYKVREIVLKRWSANRNRD